MAKKKRIDLKAFRHSLQDLKDLERLLLQRGSEARSIVLLEDMANSFRVMRENLESDLRNLDLDDMTVDDKHTAIECIRIFEADLPAKWAEQPAIRMLRKAVS